LHVAYSYFCIACLASATHQDFSRRIWSGTYASEPAEDAAATKMMRASCRRIRLAGPFPQLIGHRTAGQMWKRQLRWARLRRASFPAFFAPEALAGPVPHLLALIYGLQAHGLETAGPILFFLASWYGAELWLARSASWTRSIPAMMVRDLMLPPLFIAACAGRGFEWHGHQMSAAKSSAFGDGLLPRHLRKLRLKLAGRT
jgi:ceramide glucosyltransferase